MIKFPSIEQFRHVVRRVSDKAQFIGIGPDNEPIFDRLAKRPTLTFRGTVKLHGTNAAIVWSDGKTTFQSRERELTIEADNAGFMEHMSDGIGYETVLVVGAELGKELIEIESLAIYGEWCGGNIQAGVAINGLPKMFVIFAIKLNGEWQDITKVNCNNPAFGIYTVNDFETFHATIDFERPEESQNDLIAFTNEVEASCPVGRYFSKKGVGEGIVWTCVSEGYNSSDYWFKVKGERHSVTKVRTLAEVDIESVKTMHEFVARTLTESRLEQGLMHLTTELCKPFEMQSIGDFLRWVFNDILKEEGDTLAASSIDQKALGGQISKAAKRWYIDRLNTQGLAE